MKLLLVFGTRPEAIKMAPLVKELRGSKLLRAKVCVTAQHREMLNQVLQLFDICPDYDLDLMQPEQTLTALSCNILQSMETLLHEWRPDWLLVHGDTTTTMCASLAAYYQKISIAHVEAGLRTRDMLSPWPEEANRQVAGRLASLHFAPTQEAQQNLLDEAVPEEGIHVTGNTIIDALVYACQKLAKDKPLKAKIADEFSFLRPDKRLILVTGHRRESFGRGFAAICQALKEIAKDKSLQMIYPVHLNPKVRAPVLDILNEVENIHLIEPVDYLPFVYLMQRSHLLLTDSGGIQEEAPYLNKPVLVMRNRTERPEAVRAGAAQLVGTDRNEIVAACQRLLQDEATYDSMASADNPFGDGRASQRIRKIFEQMS